MNPVLENERVRVEFEEIHGTVVSCTHEGLGRDLVGERRLAQNWRLMVKMPAGATYLDAGGQTLDAWEVEAGSAVLQWRKLAAPEGTLDISLRQEIELEGGTLTARLHLCNDTPYSIEEVYPFCIGGMANWEEQDDWFLCWPGLVWGGEEFAFYREFPGSYIGPAKPAFAFTYPGTSVDYWQQNLSMSWTTLYNKRTGQAVYFGNHNPEVAFSAFWGELSPSASYANPRGRWGPQLWPHPGQSAGEAAIGASLGWVFFPFLRGPGTYASPPVVLDFHAGGWWESARRYRRWFNDNVARMEFDPGGMAQWDAWQATFMDTPEGRVRHRFADLPRLAAEAREAGIHVIQVSGWHAGGVDCNYPMMSEPEPRLGTREEFARAIEQCQEMGVTVLIWANANQMNLETDWYKEELHRYAIRNPHGDPQMPLGYGFDSLLHLMGYAVPRMVAGNMAHPRLRSIILAEWEKVHALGAGAFLIDKVISGEPYHLDFNPDAPGRIESSAHQSLLDAVAAFSRRLREDGVPVALETGWDRMMPHCSALYTRYFGQDHLPVQEVVFPEVKPSCCLGGDFDFGLVNKCLRFGHIMVIEGINKGGSIADFEYLQPYVKEALRLRRELADNIWWSEVIEQNVAEVGHDGAVFAGAHRSRRQRPASGSALALVLQHYQRGSKRVQISFNDPRWKTALLYRPFAEPEKASLPMTTEIPQDRVLVVIPQRD